MKVKILMIVIMIIKEDNIDNDYNESNCYNGYDYESGNWNRMKDND